jgi:UDP-N-acetylmuramyl pentapeptide phosphotransferase/UDP-N-acetylglucosamine-1-phosphate transferase
MMVCLGWVQLTLIPTEKLVAHGMLSSLNLTDGLDLLASRLTLVAVEIYGHPFFATTPSLIPFTYTNISTEDDEEQDDADEESETDGRFKM